VAGALGTGSGSKCCERRGGDVNSETVVAICALVISIAALLVSVGQTWITREHNKKSVTPVLQFGTVYSQGDTAGLYLKNVGLGPAKVVRSEVYLDGTPIGEYSQETVNRVRDTLKQRPSASTFRSGRFLPTDYDNFLLSLPDYDTEGDNELAEPIDDRLYIKFVYESLYGDRAEVSWPEPGTGNPLLLRRLEHRRDDAR
jgi:hypothetical protein